MQKYQSTCSYCGVGCGVSIVKDNQNNIQVSGNKLYPVNKGMLCSKGLGLGHVVNDTSDRLLYPLIREQKSDKLKKASWKDALNTVVNSFSNIIEKHGPDAVGFYVSGQCLTEEYYVVNKLAKACIQTNNIDTNSRLCMSSAVVGYKMALGEDAVPISYNDIELSDCIFITGANPAWCHPILFRRIEKHKQENPHVKIIVADPRKTQTCFMADIHLQLKPGTDVFLNHAIAKLIIEKGYADIDFIKQYTDGFKGLKEKLDELNIADLAESCGVPIELIHETAELIGQSKGFISMWAMGLNQSSIGVNKNLSLLNLSILTGKIGKPGNGPFSLTGQPNAMGGREVGGMANLLPAHRNLADANDRQEVADYWGVDTIPAKPGFTATQMIDAILDGKLKAIWIICTNPLTSLPNARRVEKALKMADLVVVQDISKNTTSIEFADIVLPAAAWLEKEGTMTNSDRRISYLPKAVDAPGECRSDVDILLDFAQRMGFKNMDFENNEAIFNEHKGLTKGTNIDISGLDYRHLIENGSAQWPFIEGADKGEERLFTDFKFYTPNQKAQLFAVDMDNQSEALSEEAPLILTTGRIRDQWHTMTKTGKLSKLNKHIAEPFLEIHPKDAEIRGIKDGETAVVENIRGTVQVKTVITENIREGVVFLPMHWGKMLNSDFSRANNLTSDVTDPKSKEPDFKFAAVEVKKFVKAKERIAIIGAGAAAYQFISEYRTSNKTDSIEVFSKEKHPFYNRILLPEYLTEHKSWEDIQKHKASDIKDWNIKLHTECEIVQINKEKKYIVDGDGNDYAFDKLIICTGSRPNVPPQVKIDFESTYTIRSKEDADRLKENLKGKNSVTIVGGGLLGLEIASSLLEFGIQVNVIHRNARLMDKQLDEISSQMLSETIGEMDVNLYLKDEILTSETLVNGGIEIELKSGKQFKTDALVYAIGTKPNIEIAIEAGLNTNRGVIVNERLETSQANIFAMGEIAEFQGNLYGITSAAEEQASILAKYFLGDLMSIYTGSVPMNILKFPGIELCSVGMVITPDNDEYEEITVLDKKYRYYKKCIIHKDRMVGTVLMGDRAEFGEYKGLIQSKTELFAKRKTLLRGGTSAVEVKGKVLCSCNNVGEGNISELIEKGITDLKLICEKTNAGTGCGSCKPEITMMIEKAKNTNAYAQS
ncbi:nitrate reductase [Labilibacter marinus]|uniref:nitrate reductase n=1 Tax=Labilibacter marinus TaxID=1477105 RepID=UPI00094F6E16|nr:nitrate reductase [Labilibacter marinus]